MEYKDSYEFGTDVSSVFKSKILPYVDGKKVLDVGCGTGEYMKFFGENSLGLDLSKKNLKKAKNKGFSVQHFDANNPQSLNEKYEVLFTSHLIEHIENPVNLLRFMYKHLIPKGEIIISIPNEISLVQLKYPYFTKDGNHLYGFTISNIKELLLVTGFKVDAIFFDYDTATTKQLHLGFIYRIINKRPRLHEYIKNWNEFKLLPDVIDALVIIKQEGYIPIVISNQRGIARGIMGLRDVHNIHEQLNSVLKENNVSIEKFYICPHNHIDKCKCRKPKTGMILKAAKEYNINLVQSWFVGDSEKDRLCGINSGVKTKIIPSNSSLLDAVDDIFSKIIKG